jgi:hypothetical protein
MGVPTEVALLGINFSTWPAFHAIWGPIKRWHREVYMQKGPETYKHGDCLFNEEIGLLAYDVIQENERTDQALYRRGDIVAAIALSLERLGWSIRRDTQIIDDKGNELDLQWGTPAALQKKVAQRIRELNDDALSTRARLRGMVDGSEKVYWTPVRHVMTNGRYPKRSREW